MRRIAILVVLLAGCSLYPELDGDHHTPPDAPCVAEFPPAIQLRDPQTGVCQSIGVGGCPDPCLPCAGGAGALPDWAPCDGRCEALDEATCIGTSECRAIYRDDHTGPFPQFFSCWGTARSFTSVGTCTTILDAETCSQHDNCSAIYTAGANGPDAFAKCIAEPHHDPGLCTTATCTMTPPKCPTGLKAGVLNGCYTGYCIPNNMCGVRDAGTCEVALCASASPACPMGTIPGVTNGCYSGFCIPIAACP